MPTQQRAAFLQLIFAVNLWGFSFIATRWMLESFSPYWGTSARFFTAFLVGVPVLWFTPSRKALWNDFRCSALAGVLLGGAIITQTIGLKYTSVANSAFITTLYVVFVPLIEWLFYRRKATRQQILNIVLALIGAALMCRFTGMNLNEGDLLTLVCAALSGWHIVQIGNISTKASSPLQFNVLQALWCALLALPFAIMLEPLPTSISWLSWGGVFTLAIPVHLVAFTIQVRAQKTLSPGDVSLIFLMESPLASMYAFFLFREKLDLIQMIGAVLILIAAYRTTRRPSSNENFSATA